MIDILENYFKEWEKLLFLATENTDKTVYKEFIETMKPKDSIRLLPQEVKSTFDLLQLTDKSKDIVELKTRWKYGYDDFDDISILDKKIRKILEEKEKIDANNIYLCAFFPKSDKIVLIDLTRIDYDENDIVQRNVKKQTLTDNPYKVIQQYIPLSLKKGRDNRLGTTTYKYTFKNLKDTYVNTFKRYCSKYGIPEDISDIALNQMS